MTEQIAALSDEVQRRPEKSKDDKGRVGDTLYFPDLTQFRKKEWDSLATPKWGQVKTTFHSEEGVNRGGRGTARPVERKQKAGSRISLATEAILRVPSGAGGGPQARAQLLN